MNILSTTATELLKNEDLLRRIDSYTCNRLVVATLNEKSNVMNVTALYAEVEKLGIEFLERVLADADAEGVIGFTPTGYSLNWIADAIKNKHPGIFVHKLASSVKSEAEALENEQYGDDSDIDIDKFVAVRTAWLNFVRGE